MKILSHFFTPTLTLINTVIVAATPPCSDIKLSFLHDEKEPNPKESFHSFLKQTKTVLKENINVFGSVRRETNICTNEHSSYYKAKSLPNVLETKSMMDKNRGNIEKQIRYYEYHINQINLSSQLQFPASPRKISRKHSLETQVCLNSPPQQAFKILFSIKWLSEEKEILQLPQSQAQ